MRSRLAACLLFVFPLLLASEQVLAQPMQGPAPAHLDLNGDENVNGQDATIFVNTMGRGNLTTGVLPDVANYPMDIYRERNGDFIINSLDLRSWLAEAYYFNTRIRGGSYLRGDLNLDGIITPQEGQIIWFNFVSAESGMDWSDGDFDGDGVVTALDYAAYLEDAGNQ